MEELKLNIKELKAIAQEINKSEEEKYNIKINTFPVTMVEYYKDYIPKNVSLIKRPAYLTTPIKAGGFNDLKGNTVIFIDHYHKLNNDLDQTFNLAKVCYHEARHSAQQKFIKENKESYENFLYQIEDYIKATNPYDYLSNHNEYSFEIGANLYGVQQAIEYLKRKYPKEYEKNKEELERVRNMYIYDYLMYDAPNTVDIFLKQLKIHSNKVVTTLHLNKFSEKIKQQIPHLDIFLNEKNNFKPIQDIINNPKFKQIDPKIKYAILSSQTFLDSINLNELSEEEILPIKEALEYTNQIYQNQEKTATQAYQANIIPKKQYLEQEKSLIKKVSYIYRIYRKNILKVEQMITRPETKRKVHTKNVNNYLTKLKGRNKGNITIKSFLLIISILLFLSIIIYIIINFILK